MTSSAGVAALHAADRTARDDRRDFIDELIRGEFELGDHEDLLSLGFIKSTDEGYRRTQVAPADHILQNWSVLQISDWLVRPNQWRPLYPTGALILPMLVRARTTEILDAQGENWDAVPYESPVYGIESGRYTTDEIAQRLGGLVDAVWIKNVSDAAHITTTTCSDTMFVRHSANLAYAIGARPV